MHTVYRQSYTAHCLLSITVWLIVSTFDTSFLFIFVFLYN